MAPRRRALTPTSCRCSATSGGCCCERRTAARRREHPLGGQRGGDSRERGGTMSVDVRVPDIGDFTDVAVIEVLVKPGDKVALEQSLITVESDKASMEIPSSAAGVVQEVRVAVGDKVSEGSLILRLEGADAAAAASKPAAPAPAPAPTSAPAAAAKPAAAPAPAPAAAP